MSVSSVSVFMSLRVCVFVSLCVCITWMPLRPWNTELPEVVSVSSVSVSVTWVPLNLGTLSSQTCASVYIRCQPGKWVFLCSQIGNHFSRELKPVSF